MKPFRTQLVFGFIAIGMSLAAQTFAQPTDITINGYSTGSPVVTVRQEISDFANRYGKPVIIHGALDLNAPVSIAANAGLTSDQAISAISQAAGAYAVRVYFVTPAAASDITMGSAATRLIGDRGNVNLALHHVSARAAIESVAAADNAHVKFPNGVPFGFVSFNASSLPLSSAIARVATMTRTHWTLGYMLESTNPSLPSLNNGTTVNTANTQTSGDSTAASVNPEGVPNTTSGDSTAASGGPSSNWPSGYVVTNLPPMRPLARDAEGNILPFTIHVPVTHVEPVITTNMTPQQIAAAQQAAAAENYQLALQNSYVPPTINNQNMAQSAFDPSFQPIPGNSLFGGPTSPNENYLGGNFGAVQTEIPSGMQSGFSLIPNFGY